MIDQPYSSTAEQGVIYALLFNNEWISKLSFVSVSDFHMLAHREFYSLILSTYSKNGVVDVSIMGDLLDDTEYAYLCDIWKNVPSDKNANAYARQLVEMSIRRKAMSEMSDAIEKLSDKREDAVNVIANVGKTVDSEIGRLSSENVLSIDKLIELSMDEMERSNQSIRTGISTGIEEMDCQLGYKKLAFGEITFLGGQSKNGKTTFANTVVARCELLENEVAHIFSIEMPAAGMFNGIVSAMSGVPSDFYCRQSFYHEVAPQYFDSWHGNWGRCAMELRDSQKVTIDGKKDVCMDYICSEIRKQHAIAKQNGKDLSLVVIDHLHRLDFKSGNEPRTYAMRSALRMLKNTASDLGIAVLLLGQLNEQHADKDPTAFHILDTSGARHEIQCFIGTRIFRDNGKTYFGLYSDAHRYADDRTVFKPQFMRMISGVIKPLPDEEKHWTPKESE